MTRQKTIPTICIICGDEREESMAQFKNKLCGQEYGLGKVVVSGKHAPPKV